MFLTALDDGLVEHIVHGAAELLPSVDHDQNQACDVQTAFTEPASSSRTTVVFSVVVRLW